MILVDTSVWVDFFSGRADASHLKTLRGLLQSGQPIATCGTVLYEILQGVRRDNDFAKIHDHFEDFNYLEASRRTHVQAAKMYRQLRRKGITIRKSVDCLIAATAIEHKVRLLHNDRDFDAIARHFELKILETA